jgi:two-component system LytT family sensor kinase
MRASRWQLWAAILGGWIVLSLFDASSMFLSYGYGPQPLPFAQTLLFAATDWYIWGVLAVPTVLVARRISLERGHRLRGLLILAAFGFFIAWVRVWLYGVAAEWLYATPSAPMSLRVVREWPANFLTYCVLLLAYYVVRYYRMYRERELRTSQLESGLAQARLEALRMQLHPHFLFNTLNSISTLMHRDVEAADDMVAALSDLLRVALDRSAAQEVTLKEELDILRRYLDIEQIRFGDRLNARIDVPPECLDALVPNLILQPLVENAIRHGIDPRTQPGAVYVQAQRNDGRLEIVVSDDGEGVPEGIALREGVGLANTRARLAQLYSERQSLSIQSGRNGQQGFTVSLTIPYHTIA